MTLKEKIQNLINLANEKMGTSYTTLTDSVNALINGSGGTTQEWNIRFADSSVKTYNFPQLEENIPILEITSPFGKLNSFESESLAGEFTTTYSKTYSTATKKATIMMKLKLTDTEADITQRNFAVLMGYHKGLNIIPISLPGSIKTISNTHNVSWSMVSMTSGSYVFEFYVIDLDTMEYCHADNYVVTL